MTNSAATLAWQKLVAPPRSVPPAVQARVRFAELKKAINIHNGFLGLWLLMAGFIMAIFGTAWFFGAKEEDHPRIGLLLLAGGIGILVALFTTVYLSGTRKVRILRNGFLADGTVTHVWSNLAYVPYKTAASQWLPFVRQINSGTETRRLPDGILSKLANQYRYVGFKLRVADAEGKSHHVKARLDLFALLSNTDDEPRVQLLCDPANVNDAIATSDFYPELTITDDGNWTVEQSASFLVFLGAYLRCAVPVLGTYLSSALGFILFRDKVREKLMMDLSPLAAIGVVLLLTITHAVGAVFLFRFMLDMIGEFKARVASGGQNPMARVLIGAFGVYIWSFIGMWFGAPILALAYLTGWLSLVWAAVHLAFAKRGTRAWVFIEYGSTSMALLLAVVCFSTDRLFPAGLVIVVPQALLLTFLYWKSRDRWIASASVDAMQRT